jgi:hypothetical protein
MKTFVIPCAIALLLAPVASAQLAAGNVRPVQRADSKLVDIDYDVTGTSAPVSVSLQGSADGAADGGSTWSLPLDYGCEPRHSIPRHLKVRCQGAPILALEYP